MEYQDVESMVKLVNQELERNGCKFRVTMTEDNLYVVLNTVWREKKHEVTLFKGRPIILSEAFAQLTGIMQGLKLAKI